MLIIAGVWRWWWEHKYKVGMQELQSQINELKAHSPSVAALVAPPPSQHAIGPSVPVPLAGNGLDAEWLDRALKDSTLLAIATQLRDRTHIVYGEIEDVVQRSYLSAASVDLRLIPTDRKAVLWFDNAPDALAYLTKGQHVTVRGHFRDITESLLFLEKCELISTGAVR